VNITEVFKQLLFLVVFSACFLSLKSDGWLNAMCLWVSAPCGLSSCPNTSPPGSYKNTSPCITVAEVCVLLPFLWCLCSGITCGRCAGLHLNIAEATTAVSVYSLLYHLYRNVISVFHTILLLGACKTKKPHTIEPRLLHWVKNNVLTQVKKEVLFKTCLLS